MHYMFLLGVDRNCRHGQCSIETWVCFDTNICTKHKVLKVDRKLGSSIL